MYVTYLTLLVGHAAAVSLPLTSRQSSQTLTVDTTKKYQTIDGFGFSAAFQRANLIVNLEKPQQTEVLDLLFNTTTGAGFSIVRNGIGSSKTSQNDWMNTILPTCPSSSDGTPNYVWDEKDSGQLFLSQKAVEYGVKTFYGDAWSAPGCMKTNGDDANGGYLCGVSGATCASGDWRQAYANYLVKYIRLYAQSGVPVTHIGFLNEPDFNASYAGMLSSGTQAADFIKVLRPTLDAANLTSVGINCCEATGWDATKEHVKEMEAAGVIDSVYAVTSHEYSSRISGILDTPTKVWQTEYSVLSGSWSTPWYSDGGAGDGYTWANTIFDTIVHSNLSAYLYWEGVQDRATNGNNNEKLILVDGQEYEASKRLWAFAQWRVVRPGAVRVGVSGPSGVKSAAFMNKDGSVAVVAINTGTDSQTIGVGGVGVKGKARAWYTDNANNMTATEVAMWSDGTASATVSGRGMISFLFTSDAPGLE